MYSAGGTLLYVGKAKNLRARLRSYKNARPSTTSRKVLRLIRMVHSIELRSCVDETDALLTENRLLRELQPPFNVLNTYPETYFFITVQKCGQLTRLRLTTESDDRAGCRIYGVFKGRGSVRNAFLSLLRILSVMDLSERNVGSFVFPMRLLRERPPAEYDFVLTPELRSLVCAYLNGASKGLLRFIVERLLERIDRNDRNRNNNEELPRFAHRIIEEDLKTLNDFFAFGPRRTRKIKRLANIRGRPIAQHEIDDLIVLQTMK